MARKSKNDPIVKSNDLVTGSYSFTLIEYRMMMLAIIAARSQEMLVTSEDLIPVYATDYAKAYAVNPKNSYAEMKKGADLLLTRQWKLYDTRPSTGSPRTVKGVWVTTCTYVKGDGCVEFQFHAKVIPYFTVLDKYFTQIDLKNIAKLRSVHAIRIYELCISWLGETRTSQLEKTVGVEWIKEVLQLGDDYKNTGDLKRWAIDPSMKQINKHTDITLECDTKRSGRKITHFVFSFGFKEDGAAPEVQPKAASKAEPLYVPLPLPPVATPKPRKPAKRVAKTPELPEGLSSEKFAEYKAHRQTSKAPLNHSNIKTLFEEIEIARAAGISPAECMRVALSKPWSGFRAEWVQNHLAAKKNSSQQRKVRGADARADLAARSSAAFMESAADDDAIDITSYQDPTEVF